MSAEIDKLLQQMAELQGVVIDHQKSGDNATIDYARLAGELQKLNEAQQPVRRGEEIPAPGAAPVRSGKYAGVDPLNLYLAKKVLEAQQRQSDGVGPSKDLTEAVAKAMTSTGTATGDELVPTDMAAGLWDDIYAATRVASLLTPQLMTSDPMDISLSLGDATFRKGTQNTATTVSDLATAKSTLTTTEEVAEVNWSYALDEDAVVAMMPAIRDSLARNGAEYVDRFVLNADATNAGTGNINLDDADPADDSYYLSDGQDGIRHQWIVDNTGQQVAGGGAAISDAMLRSAFKLLGKYYQDAQSDVVIVPDYTTYLKGMLALTNVVTVDKMGAQATVLTGQLGSYMGVPIVPSSFHPLGEADGKVSTTPGNNTLGSVSVFNRRMWRLGYRRGVTIEVDRLIQKRQYIMVCSFRIAVGTRGTRATNSHTSGILNILLT
jgi:HK97 family phage major capsid protein